MKDGIYYDMPRADYDRIDRVNWSTLKHMGKSPAHYRHEVDHRDSEDTDARKRGRVVHLAVLEPEKFAADCVVFEGTRKGKLWDACCEDNADKEILTPAMHAAAVEARDAVRGCAQAAPYLIGGASEVTLLWTHVVPQVEAVLGYSVECKARVDYLAPAALLDLKSTKDASPEGFGRQAAAYQMHVQAAWYGAALTALKGFERPYMLIAIEAAPPCVAQVYQVGPELLALGRSVCRGLLDRLDLCRRLDSWPGYAGGVMGLEFPRWALPRDTEGEEE
jgi:exodeoxyribonuclease VIII